jgi:5-methylcytosine-specific restriction endonuclease McrA
MSAVIHYAPRKTEPRRLGQEIAELCSYIHAATCHLLELIREFDEGRHWEEQGFRSCVEWLGFHCGLGPGAAREHLRVAHALPGLPKIGEAFADGRLSYSKVRAMTRVATPANEGFLMMVAKHGAASHVERLVSQYRRVQKLEHPDKAGELYLARETTYHFDDDGCLMMKVRVPADRGELVVKALEMAMEAAYDPDDESPVAARRTDALCDVAETYLNHPESSGSTADRYQVVIHTQADGAAQVENGPHVSAETLQRVSCDCCVTEIEEDRYGEVLNIGRRSRTIPPAMRRALKARDGGCRFPGCTNHKFVDGHHIQHWSQGGETSLDNLVLLCRHHHHLVHEGGFDCRKGAEGEIYFVDRRHQRLREFQETPRVSVEESMAWMYRKFAEADVSAETSKAQWHAGEELDMEYAVWVLAGIRRPD